MKEEIVNKLYKAYGTDSGILFGISDRDIVEFIVGFAVNHIEDKRKRHIERVIDSMPSDSDLMEDSKI